MGFALFPCDDGIRRRDTPKETAQRTPTHRRFLVASSPAAHLALPQHDGLLRESSERAAANLVGLPSRARARSLALVAIVIGGLMFMFGEGGAKRQISGIVFGGGLALFAAQFLAWLF